MLIPSWSAPATVKAICFDKTDAPNLPNHLLPSAINRLNQVHDNTVLEFPKDALAPADGSYTRMPNIVCTIATADCLAIYLCTRQGDEIALLHGGWRGLSKGIIKAGLAKFKAQPHRILAHLGPAISQQHYEVGKDVFDAFCQTDASLTAAFKKGRPGHFYLDLYTIARYQLKQLGVEEITGGEYCTFSDDKRFYSYRREPQNPGRLLHCIWKL
jgi:polyphenol oxidase